MQASYKKIILGASCWSAGHLLKDDKNVLVIDRRASVGSEFFNAYRNCTNWYDNLKSDIANELKNKLKNLNILNGDSTDFYSLAPILYDRLKPFSKNLMLMTELENISIVDDVFTLTVYNQSGKLDITCTELIDTTSTCISNRKWGAENILQKRLYAALDGENIKLTNSTALQFRKGRSKREAFVSSTFNNNVDWCAARKQLIEEFNACACGKIASIAKEFDYDFKERSKRFQRNWMFLSPVMFDNPLLAFDAGWLQGEEQCI